MGGDVGLSNRNRCRLSCIVQSVLIAPLLGIPTFLDERCRAVIGHLGEFGICLRLLHRCLVLRELSFGLVELLVDLRRVDLRQQVAFPNVSANIEVPGLEIAAGPRGDRRIRECLGVARQHDFLIRGTDLRMNDRDARNGGFQGRASEFLFGIDAIDDVCVDDSTHGNDRRRYQPGEPQAAALSCRAVGQIRRA